MTSVSTETPGHHESPVLRLDIEQNPDAPALARAAITGFCETRGMDETTVATLKLLVSEIVTNAVIHPDVRSPAKIRLWARIAPDSVRIEVTDGGSGFTPRPRNPAQIGGGYGLYLVDKQAARWGVQLGGGTTVWFEVIVS